MAALMLVLAFAFMLPGLPPLRVAAPMEFLLPFHPWQRYYPEITSPFLGGDLLLQQLPWHHWAQDEWAAGRFPAWSSGPAGGMPLHASSQAAVLYPLHLLWALLPVGAGLGVIMALKLWLAGLGMWFFLRALDLHPAAAGLSALSFMFSTSLVNWLPWQLSGLILLLPWLLWAVYAWWTRDSRPALLGVATLVGFMVLGGHAETLFIMGLTTAGWTLALMLVSGGTWQSRLLRLAGTSLAVALGFLLGMVQLLPFLDAVSLTHQFAARQAQDVATASTFKLRPEFLLDWLVPRSQGYQPDLVLPRSFGFTEGNGYVGLVPIVGLGLALIAAFRRRLRLSLALPWLCIGVFALLVAYDGTVGPFIRALPGFAQSINVRWVMVVGFAIIMLGAFGWDWLARAALSPKADGEGAWRRLALVEAVTLVALGGVVMLAHALRLLPYPVMEHIGPSWLQLNDTYGWYWAVWTAGVFVAVLGLAFLWLVWRRGPRVVPALLGLLLIADLWWLLIPINGTSPAEQYYPVTDFIRQVKASVPATERVLIEDDVMPANTGLVYNIRDWRAGDPMLTQRAYRTMRVLAPDTFKSLTDEYNVYLRNPRHELAPLLGMRYYIMPWDKNPTGSELPNRPDFTRLARKDGLSLWRAEGVPGFAYLSDNVQAAPDEEQALNWLKAATWDTARTYSAVAEAGADKLSGIKPVPGVSPGNVEVLEYTSGHILLRVNAARPALLVVSESWYPGWQASMDNQPVEVLRTNYLSQGVVVSQGEHVIQMDYHPTALNLGAGLSLLGLAGTVGLGVWARRSRRGPAQRTAANASPDRANVSGET
jgi:hypothetical protein